MKDWVDLERKTLLQKEAKTALRLSKLKNKSPLDARFEQALRRPDYEILPQNESDYGLPPDTEKLVSKEIAAELTGILLDVQAINDEFAGFTTSHATVVLAEDPRSAAIALRLRDWINRYADHRAERTRHLENTPVKRFIQLNGELYWDLTKLFFKQGTVNGILLDESSLHIPWSLMKRTCSDLLHFEVDPETLRTSYTTLAKDDDDHDDLCHYIGWCQWSTEPRLSFVLERVAASLCDDEFKQPEAEMRKQLKDLVTDVQGLLQAPCIEALQDFVDRFVCLHKSLRGLTERKHEPGWRERRWVIVTL